MRNTLRVVLVTAFLSMLCVGAASLVTMRAAAQQSAPRATQPESRPAAEASEAAKAAAAADGQTIIDDPTAVPDSQESADNNVSFPVDI